MEPLSAAQMGVVEHGLAVHPPADDVVIHYTEHSEGSYYAMKHLDYSHPLARTSQGYCEVYRQVAPGEKWDGWWFSMRATNGGGSGSTPYATKEEAEANVRRQVTGDRAFWDGYAARVESGLTTNGERIVRSKGQHYVIAKVYRGNGFGGHLWVWRFIETGEEIETRNLWSQGRIPDDYRERMPDNAVDVTPPREPINLRST